MADTTLTLIKNSTITTRTFWNLFQLSIAEYLHRKRNISFPLCWRYKLLQRKEFPPNQEIHGPFTLWTSHSSERGGTKPQPEAWGEVSAFLLFDFSKVNSWTHDSITTRRASLYEKAR